MAKLVVLKQGSPGATYELKAERTTVGRMDDNTFQIAEPSVSSHHCEILMSGGEFVIKDLDSTNGTYIDGTKIAEAKLKPGQSLRLGEVEIQFDPEKSNSLKNTENIRTHVQGSILKELKPESKNVHIDQTVFTKKSNKTDKMFIIGGSVMVVVILGLLVYALFLMAK